jgi:hypothetical protein
VLAYVKGTLNQGLSYHDPGVGQRNKQSGRVDSDFAGLLRSSDQPSPIMAVVTPLRRVRGVVSGCCGGLGHGRPRHISDDDDVFYLFLQKQKKEPSSIYTLRKIRTIRSCLEGLTLMI